MVCWKHVGLYRSDEEAKHIEGLHMLLRRLRLIVDRQSAKPSELLLDDLLSRMGQPDWSDAEEQQQVSCASSKHVRAAAGHYIVALPLAVRGMTID